ncbi:MAG: hypothetical protein ACT6QS_09430 [Flavobacteriales bacterium]
MLLHPLRVMWILPFLCPAVSAAQYVLSGARAASAGNASLCVTDVYAVFNNQASMARLEKPAICSSYENRFISRELNSFGLACVLPFRAYGVFGLSLQRSGFQLFSRNRIGLSYARTFGRRVSAGLQFNYQLLHIAQGYGTAHVFSADAGIRIQISPEISWALHVSNPIRQKVADFQQEKLPLILKTGLMYVWNRSLSCAVQLEKDFDRPFNFGFGLEYTWKEKVAFRAGFQTLPLSPSFGFGYLHKRIQLDIGVSYKRYAGFSPQLSLNHTFARAL